MPTSEIAELQLQQLLGVIAARYPVAKDLAATRLYTGLIRIKVLVQIYLAERNTSLLFGTNLADYVIVVHHG